MTYQMDLERWARLSVVEQMANIGSEVSRAISARRAGDVTRCDHAIERALDLFDLTTEVLVSKRAYRVREVLRAKDQFLQLFYGDDQSFGDAPALEEYFLQFGVAARA